MQCFDEHSHVLFSSTIFCSKTLKNKNNTKTPRFFKTLYLKGSDGVTNKTGDLIIKSFNYAESQPQHVFLR